MYQFSETQQLEDNECSMATNLICCTNRSFFLTGKPATGKTSFLLNAARQSGKNFIFLSPTLEAALYSGGSTIRSFFHLPYSPFNRDTFTDAQKSIINNYRKEKRQIIEQAELIIIDDVASVRADIIDAIDFRLRNFGGKKNMPFGGKQLVFAGDTFQLPELATGEEWEVLKRNYDTPYFFSARALLKADLPTIEFKHIHHKRDEQFNSLLNRIRSKQMLQQDIEQINIQHVPDFSPLEQDCFVTITANQTIADEINQQRLEEMPGALFSYHGKLEGRLAGEINDELLPVNKVLELRENAQVVFIKDDAAGRWTKGTTGKIHALKNDSITVAVNTSGDVELQVLEKTTWENYRYKLCDLSGQIGAVAVGSFTQFPVRLAWAVSLDKSRGFSFDKVIVDAGNPATGSAYMALSRCKSLEGIKIKTPLNYSKILVRDEVVRQSLSANNERVISETITNGKADKLYSQSVQAFDLGNFELAVASLTKAIALRNDTANPSFKRLMAMKLNNLKNKQEEKTLPIQKFIWMEEAEKVIAANVGIAESSELLHADSPVLKKLETGRYPVEQIIEQLNSNGLELETASHEMLITRSDFEENLATFQSSIPENSSAVLKLEEEVRSVKKELQQQQQETAGLTATLKSLNDAEANRNFESKRAVKYWTELNSDMNYLETEVEKWKKIVIIGGMIFCLVITILLFIMFRI